MNGKPDETNVPDGAAMSIQALKVLGVAILAVGSIVVFISEYKQLQFMKEDEGYF